MTRTTLSIRTICLLFALACAKSPQSVALDDPRIGDAQRSWLVDAEDEVAIAKARIDDARGAIADQRGHHDALMARIRAAGVDPGPWQRLGRARATLADKEHRRAVARLEHATARLSLVQAEVAMGADLAVYKLEPLRADVARRRARLAERVREVEAAHIEAEDQADAAWVAWRRHLTLNDGGIGAFWQREPMSSTDGVADAE